METAFNTSLWGDEGFSAILSMKSLPEIIKIIATDTSPPLWNIWEWFVFNTFGTDEIYIRGLAFTFFLGTVFFTYKIGTHLFGRKTAIIAGLLTFLNPFFFTYGFEGRMYSIMALGVAASMYFFLKRRWIPYIIATLWALYSHHFAFFVVFTQGLWFIYEFVAGEKKRAFKMFRAFIFVGIGYLPWVIPLYNQTKMVGGGFWLGTPTIKDLVVLLFDYLANGIKNESLKIPIIGIPLYQISLVLVLIAAITRNWFKRYKKTLFLLSWFLVPILATWVISQYFQSIFFNRYLLYTIPAGMLVLASNRRGVASLIILGVTLFLFAIIDYHYFTHPIKLPFRQMSEYVLETKNDNDYLINWNAGSHHLWETKYYGFPSPIYISPDAGDLPFFVGTALMGEGDIVRYIPESAERVGVTTSGNVEDIILPGYTESEVKVLGNLKFVWMNKDE
jgi:hypothetical protein